MQMDLHVLLGKLVDNPFPLVGNVIECQPSLWVNASMCLPPKPTEPPAGSCRITGASRHWCISACKVLQLQINKLAHVPFHVSAVQGDLPYGTMHHQAPACCAVTPAWKLKKVHRLSDGHGDASPQTAQCHYTQTCIAWPTFIQANSEPWSTRGILPGARHSSRWSISSRGVRESPGEVVARLAILKRRTDLQ